MSEYTVYKLPIPLTTLQEICKQVETEMLEFLLQYSPMGNMTVDDVKTIARFARSAAFNAFDVRHPRDVQIAAQEPKP